MDPDIGRDGDLIQGGGEFLRQGASPELDGICSSSPAQALVECQQDHLGDLASWQSSLDGPDPSTELVVRDWMVQEIGRSLLRGGNLGEGNGPRLSGGPCDAGIEGYRKGIAGPDGVEGGGRPERGDGGGGSGSKGLESIHDDQREARVEGGRGGGGGGGDESRRTIFDLMPPGYRGLVSLLQPKHRPAGRKDHWSISPAFGSASGESGYLRLCDASTAERRLHGSEGDEGGDGRILGNGEHGYELHAEDEEELEDGGVEEVLAGSRV
ncbi:hypothetical protein IE53DRAFT_110985 [Violaceomyces palustris]|uniref:Uncharacterized protein n=1 Tax=Violaceomyces palustris TaxID=1673888 RepID=A0ACD0NWG7_9BASI|nr:hypothetical protein IE53DRAFT_110985 [Violaceomyces palustris]